MFKKKVVIEDITTKLYNIATLNGKSESMIPKVCHEAMMEISFLRDRVVLLEKQMELMAAVNVQMREELEGQPPNDFLDKWREVTP